MQTSTKYRRFTAAVWFTLLFAGWSLQSQACEWMTWTSTYTHDPASGQRVDQFAQPEAPASPYRPDFQRSGFRHYRSTLQTGQSADNLHIVEEWGRPVIPYEAWRFPFRPYGVPYGAWGPQPGPVFLNTPVLPGPIGPVGAIPQYAPFGNGGGYGYAPNGNLNGGFGGGFGGGFPGFFGPNAPQAEYRNQPWFDGTYPDAAPMPTPNFGRGGY